MNTGSEDWFSPSKDPIVWEKELKELDAQRLEVRIDSKEYAQRKMQELIADAIKAGAYDSRYQSLQSSKAGRLEKLLERTKQIFESSLDLLKTAPVEEHSALRGYNQTAERLMQEFQELLQSQMDLVRILNWIYLDTFQFRNVVTMEQLNEALALWRARAETAKKQGNYDMRNQILVRIEVLKNKIERADNNKS